MKLEEFMTTKIEYVDADGSVYDAIEKMVDRRIRSLVVRFPGKETDQGVITARDVVFKVLAKGVNPRNIKVSEIASKPLVCIDLNMGLDDVTRIMEEYNVARSFVCEGEKIMGVISLLDVMAAALIIRARGDYVS
ncbi:MAG: CBS domain-containing protein [Deltaproteobacteria bacterium]|nr:CBS domain-containing protein [Deltaproteobacteria bacterium]MBW2075125.1 CBS domain-containing protein [Deltaproteobacteria bacterium]